jgi:uncharacterized protein with HEPN domain
LLPDDLIRLRHMLDAAEEISSFIDGKDLQNFEQDRMLSLSVIKSLEIIGEAAGRVSEPTRKDLLEVPWADIVGMRNRLIHGYFDMNLQIVWQTVQTDLPPLIQSLEKYLNKPEN